MSVPNHNEDRVTCSSCRFPFPKVRGFCPICGTAVSPDDTTPHITGLDAHELNRSFSFESVRHSLRQLFRNPLPALVPIALLGCMLYFFVIRGVKPAQGNTKPMTLPVPTEPGSATSIAVPGPAPTSNSNGVTLASATQKDAQVHDPAALWKQVKQGNIGAEVQLAQIYIDGMRVRQNCEQAHLLLLAAEKKGSNDARDILTGSYAQHCP